jgi:NitT/TauT family transport system substrate-binding protein
VSKRKLLIVLTLVVSAIAIAASAASARPSRQAAQLQTLKLSVFPSMDYAPLYVGLKLGIWKRHGLELKINYVYTGSALVASVLSGDADVGTNSVSSTSNAIAQGIPLIMVQPASIQPTKGNTEVLVKADSPYRKFADLAGKTVGTVNLQGAFHLGLMMAIEKQGGDPQSIKALAGSPVDSPALVLAGRLDAAVIQDPFLAQARDKYGNQLRSLGNPFGQVPYKLPIGVFFTSTSTLAKKKPLLTAFRAAYKDAVAAANKHPKLTQQIVPKYAGLDPSLMPKITLPEYVSTMSAAQVGPMLKQLRTFGWVGQSLPGWEKLYWNGK